MCYVANQARIGQSMNPDAAFAADRACRSTLPSGAARLRPQDR